MSDTEFNSYIDRALAIEAYESDLQDDLAGALARADELAAQLAAMTAAKEAAETENGQFVAALVEALGGDPSAVQNEALLVSAVALMRAEIAALRAQLAQYDLGEWEDDRLREWLPDAAEVELRARLDARYEDCGEIIDDNADLRAQLAAQEWRPAAGSKNSDRS